MFTAADMAELYDEGIGTPVLLAGETAPRFGLFAEPGAQVLGEEMIVTEPTLRYPVAQFPAMQRGQSLTVAGRAWRVRTTPTLLADGLEAVVMLERAA